MLFAVFESNLMMPTEPARVVLEPKVVTAFRPVLRDHSDDPTIAVLLDDKIKGSLGPRLWGILKDYQKDGIRDIMASFVFGVPVQRCRGLFLADGPGIGKTLQTFCAAVAIMDYAQVDSAALGSGALVLVPPNLLKSSWQDELQSKWMRYIPMESRLELLFVTSMESARRLTSLSIRPWTMVICASSVLTHVHGRSKGAATSRGLPEFMRNRRWAMVAVDESHTFKGDKTVRQTLLQELCSLGGGSTFNVFLSGTPLLNGPQDVLGLSPLVTGDGQPLPNIDAVRQDFMLRRVWAENSPGISNVQTTMLPVTLSSFERSAYDVLVDLGQKDSRAAQGNNIVRLNLLTKLRQFVDDPRLLYESIRDRREKDLSGTAGTPATKRQRTQWLKDNVGDGPDLPEDGDSVNLLFWDHYADAHLDQVFLAGLESSGYGYRSFLDHPELQGVGTKTRVTMALLSKLLQEDPESTVLVFTQFVDQQVILEDLCRFNGWTVGRLYGDMKDSLRDASITTARRGGFQVFIAMLQCACTGLNLQDSGYRIIFLEPSWTPALEEQGIGRMHRLGQRRPVVEVYRLFVSDSVESRALDIQNVKVDLMEDLVGTQDGLRAKLAAAEGRTMVNQMFRETFGGGPGR